MSLTGDMGEAEYESWTNSMVWSVVEFRKILFMVQLFEVKCKMYIPMI